MSTDGQKGTTRRTDPGKDSEYMAVFEELTADQVSRARAALQKRGVVNPTERDVVKLLTMRRGGGRTPTI